MARLKILREEIEEIVAVADRLARRTNGRFELNAEKVEVIDHLIPADVRVDVVSEDESALKLA